MALFKSKEERRIERDIQIRQGIAQIKRQINVLSKSEQGYLEKARRAKQIGSEDQLSFLKQTIKRTMAQRMMLERQLLSIETAAQMKGQAESYSVFAKSMNAVSKAIGEVFGATDLAKTQKEFERAMAQADTMEQRMAVFLDMTNDTLGSMDSMGDDIVNDADIDRLIESEAMREEKVMDEEIAKGLKDIERELGRDK